MDESFLVIAFRNAINILFFISLSQIIAYCTSYAIISAFRDQCLCFQQRLQSSLFVDPLKRLTLIIIGKDRMGIFQMSRIISYSDVYQRVRRKWLPYLVSRLRTKQTIESPVRPAEPSRIGNLAQCPDGTVRTRVHHGFGPRENPFHPVVEFPAGSQKAGQSQYKHEDSISSHIILPINLLFPGL